MVTILIVMLSRVLGDLHEDIKIKRFFNYNLKYLWTVSNAITNGTVRNLIGCGNLSKRELRPPAWD